MSEFYVDYALIPSLPETQPALLEESPKGWEEYLLGWEAGISPERNYPFIENGDFGC